VNAKGGGAAPLCFPTHCCAARAGGHILGAREEPVLDPRLNALLEDNYWILLTHALSAAVFAWLLFAVFLRARRSPVVRAYLTFQSAFFLWLLAKLAAAATLDPGVKWGLVVVQYLGFCSLTPGLFVFAFLGAWKRMPRPRLFVPLIAPSLLFFVAVATNPLHHLFFASWDIFDFLPGPLFYPHRIYEYSLGIVAAVLWGRDYLKEGRGTPITLWLFFAAILAPLATNIISLLDDDVLLFDLTPVGFTVSIVFFSVAIFRRQLLDITPLARRAALRYSPESLLLFERRGRPLAWNVRMQAALRTDRLRPRKAPTPLGDYLRAACSAAPLVKSVAALPRLETPLRRGSRISQYIVETVRGEHWRVAVAPVESWGSGHATLLRAIDITAQVRLREELAMRMRDLDEARRELGRQAEMARETAEIRARNALARDVHDILGHSLVLVISLLEVARMSPGQHASALASATRILQGCLADLRSVPEDRPGRAGFGLPKFLEATAAEVRRAGVDAELIVQGRAFPLEAARTEALMRVCQEAITNALRHGAATRIGIVLRYHVSGCELYVENNGRGTREFTKGFGLSGIEARLAELGGEARFLSDGESGFLVRAFVPRADEVREGCS
jgi:signal transduction histidine kinase